MIRRMFGVFKSLVFAVICTGICASIILSSGCRADKANREAQQLSAEFSSLLKNEIRLPDQKNDGKYRKLLDIFKNRADCDEGELLKARILIRLGNYDDAIKKLAPLVTKKSNVKLDAQLSYTRALLCSGKGIRALKLFKEIEPKIKKENRSPDFYSTWIHLALYSPDPVVRETYGLKLVKNTALPGSIKRLHPFIYMMLAFQATEKNQTAKAKEFLDKAIEATEDAGFKNMLRNRKKSLDLLKKNAPQPTAATWINSPLLTADSLKGKCVVIFFWAPWSEPCRFMLPRFETLSREFKDRNTIVIGLTKLYGTISRIRDTENQAGNNPPLNKTDELAAVEALIKNEKITFPIAVSSEGIAFENFGVTHLPATAIIDKTGTLVHLSVGNDPMGQYGYYWQSIKNKIKTIVEEK